MTIANITKLLSGQTPVPGVFEFNAPVTLTEADKKTLRSAVLRFNLTHPESDLISSVEPVKVKLSIRDELKNGNRGAWLKVACFVGVAAVTVFFGIRLYRYHTGVYVKAMAEAIDKVASGRWTTTVRTYGVISYRRAVVSDFITPIWPYFLAEGTLMGLGLLISYTGLFKSRYIDKLEVTIKPFERLLPATIANDRDEATGEYIDPITLENIPERHIKSPKYIYLGNYVVEASVCMKAILNKPLIRDHVGSVSYTHLTLPTIYSV